MRPAMIISLPLAALAGCAAIRWDPPPAITPEILAAGAAQGLDNAAVQRGHDVYATSCAECHAAVDPRSRTDAKWAKVLPEMDRKADLDPEQSADVRAYISAVRAAPAPGR
jgi:mono/diheme cytochrome c family protein